MALQAPKILIVDDALGMAETCGKLFRRQGLIPILAMSGKEALAHLESDSSIEIILTDLIMPDLSGVELLQAVKRHDPRVAEEGTRLRWLPENPILLFLSLIVALVPDIVLGR